MNILEQFNNLKVLVVGDVMIDAYFFGKVERISPEAPVPVVAVERKENRLGGAANVALNLVSLGAKPTVCSVIGKDNEGHNLVQLFEQSGIDTSGIVASEQRTTTVKLRVISQATQMLRIDTEDTHSITDTESTILTKRIFELLPESNVLIFEDYDKGVLTSQNIQAITKRAKELGIPVVVDPKKRNFNAYNGASLFKPNLKELREGLKIDIDADDKSQLENAISQMMAEMQIEHTMVTMSERGVMITNGKQFHYLPAHIRKIADVSGAGDTVVSVAALCMAVKMDLPKIAAIANLAGGLVCEEVGVVPIDQQKLQAELKILGW